MSDWTVDRRATGCNSAEFQRLCDEVERIIRGSAVDLIAGRADVVARVIMATLAHTYGLAPP